MAKNIFLPILLAYSVAVAHVTGSVQITDGDTVKIDGIRIRLHGIDAPETNQLCEKAGQLWSCGRASTEALAKLIDDQLVTCIGDRTDRYKRLIAVCYVDETDLNAAMVDAGMAFAYRKYSLDYVVNEEKARNARIGMWTGNFIDPWDWRRGKRLVLEE